jgi:hypothetical protein
MSDKKQHASGSIEPGDTSQRVGAEVLRERGCDPEAIRQKRVDAVGAEFTTYYYYTNLRMHLAGEEDYEEMSESKLPHRVVWTSVGYSRSNRSSVITLCHASTKSSTNFSSPSSAA